MRIKTHIWLFFLLAVAGRIWAGGSDSEVKELKRVQESNAKILADLQQEVSQLRQEVQALKGLTEETKYFFQQESEKNGKLLRDFDFRLTGIEERIALHQKQLEEFLKRPPKGSAKESEEGDYKRALSETNMGNYKDAIKLFEEFLKKYPNSSLADNAQYWKGEGLYATKDFAGALIEFQKVVKNYLQSEKRPGAILKQGYCLYEQQSYQEAKAFLNKVITEYPKSDEAEEAKERLKKIDGINYDRSQPPNQEVRPPDSH